MCGGTDFAFNAIAAREFELGKKGGKERREGVCVCGMAMVREGGRE